MSDPATPDPARRALAPALSWLQSRPQAARGLADRIDWAHIRKDWDGTKAFLARHYVAIVILGALAVSLGALLIGLWRVPFLVNALLDDLQANAADPDATRGTVVALAAVLAAITIIGTLIAQSIRVWTGERDTRTKEQGHVTDRLTKAIEQLGAEKTVKRILTDADGNDVLKENVPVVVETTVPNLEVRLGAIYALERIAKDSERDHVTVMEILCAYVRENAKGGEAPANPVGELPPRSATDGTDRRDLLMRRKRDLRSWLRHQPQPRIDIQAAVTVIGRRPKERQEIERKVGFHLDLSGVNLRRANLAQAHLESADLRYCHLEWANLAGARMAGVDMRQSRLEGAVFSEAEMQHANLRGARAEGANFCKTQLQKAVLKGARLEVLDLTGANLQGSDLMGARMEGADLSGAQLQGADLRWAGLEGTDLTGTQLHEGALIKWAKLDDADLTQADFRNGNWVSTSSLASLTHFADLRTRQNLTQSQLEYFIGNDGTLLPDRLNENDEHYYVWSCWETPPKNFDAIVAMAAGPLASATDRDHLRRQFLSSPDNPRRKTGTPLALDAPYPEGHPLAGRRD